MKGTIIQFSLLYVFACRFLRGPEDDAPQAPSSWGARLARRYYARLFKEYAIADLSRCENEIKAGLTEWISTCAWQ